jgi:DNA-binding MurR/RpiR family transcriptional regulator
MGVQTVDRDILSVIEEAANSFSKGQRNIARYISENYDKAAFMTASKLGETVGVSESTVVRFASELGYDGYPAMRKALQEMVRNCLTSVQRIEVSKDIMRDQDVLTAVLTSDIEKINITLEETDRDQFSAAVEAMTKAENIYIVGLRSAASLANFMGFYLNMISDNIRIVNESSSSEIFERLLRVTDKDAFIAISFPRYSQRTIKAMKYVRDVGAKIIAITDSESSPVAQLADISLLARSDMVSFVDSLVAPMSLINALVVAFGMKKENEMFANFEKLEKIWADYEVYEKADD